jgi:hypothetical protein
MNRDYAFKKEDEDYILLKDFNKVLKLSDLGQTPKYSTSDASGTSLNRYINIELKRRNQTLTKDFKISGETYTADTVYLESHKAGDLLLDFVCEDKIPLYINFLNEGYVLLFNLSKLKHRPKKVCKKIYSKLYQGFELAKREELLVSDAWIYKRINNEYKLIHKP